MSGRRLNLVHNLAQDLGPESSSPNVDRRRQAVSGFATFYLTNQVGWEKISPGRLEIAELWGGASGDGNHEFLFVTTTLLPPKVEFYINMRKPSRSFVACNLPSGDVFTFGFFGRKY